MQQFKSARRAGVPIVAIETADPAQTVLQCTKALGKKEEETAIYEWDIIRALRACNPPALAGMGGISQEPQLETGNPAECLRLLQSAPQNSVVFFHNAQRFVSNEAVMQGVWNLRDMFKAVGSTLVLLGSSITLPEELKQDAVLFSEPLPSAQEIQGIVKGICADAEISVPPAADAAIIVDSLLGLSAFAAEQTLAMSVTKEGIDKDGLWDRKCKMIEQTPGLSVYRGKDRFDGIGGCQNVKEFVSRILKGRKAPRAIVFIDEIEKAMAGSQSDTSGVSQDFLRGFLTYMQDREAAGMIFIGPPGAAKSAIAKAAGNEIGIPTINFDLGGMKGSLVGESERSLRTALQVVDAVSNGETLFIATCNSIGVLPPELRRRFTLGTFFFDLPTTAERADIWEIYGSKYEVPCDCSGFDDEGWTGAEIKQCCQIAWRLNCTLEHASSFIVPVAKSAADQIEKLRTQATGRFISASGSGIYTYNPQAKAPTGRRIQK